MNDTCSRCGAPLKPVHGLTVIVSGEPGSAASVNAEGAWTWGNATATYIRRGAGRCWRCGKITEEK